jgi:AcrR family transcriptional regulator
MDITPDTLNRRERKKSILKKHIVETAMELFKTQSFQATTMGEIADKVDIAKATLYNYFPLKETILSEFVQQSIADRVDEVRRLIQESPGTRTVLFTLFKYILQWALKHRDLMLIYWSYHMQRLSQGASSDAEWSETANLITEILVAGQKAGDIKKSISIETMARSLDANLNFTITGFLLRNENTNPDDYIYMMIDLFLTGAATTKARINEHIY